MFTSRVKYQKYDHRILVYTGNVNPAIDRWKIDSCFNC